MRRELRALVVLGLLATPVAAQDYNKGLKAYDRGDFSTALQEWRPLAERGKASAQFNLGQMYFLGRGVPQDYAEALKWHTLAAEQGDGSAQSVIGNMYATGRGVRQDLVRAYMWHALAGESIGDGKFIRDERATRDDVARHLTPEQLAGAQKLTREWMASH
jgi:hypothetical protein